MKSHPCTFFPVFWSLSLKPPSILSMWGHAGAMLYVLIIRCSSIKCFCVVQRALPAGQRGDRAGAGQKLVPLLGVSSQLLGPAQHSRGSQAAPASHNAIVRCSFELDRTGGPVAFSLRDL